MGELKTKILDEYIIKIENAYGVQTISVYNKDNKYVGDLELFKTLVKKYGITKIQTYNDNNVCSIGFNEKENRWYGWSHRAIHSFGVGDEVKEHDLTNTSGYLDSYIKELDSLNLLRFNLGKEILLMNEHNKGSIRDISDKVSCRIVRGKKNVF